MSGVTNPRTYSVSKLQVSLATGATCVTHLPLVTSSQYYIVSSSHDLAICGLYDSLKKTVSGGVRVSAISACPS